MLPSPFAPPRRLASPPSSLPPSRTSRATRRTHPYEFKHTHSEQDSSSSTPPPPLSPATPPPSSSTFSPPRRRGGRPPADGPAYQPAESVSFSQVMGRGRGAPPGRSVVTGVRMVPSTQPPWRDEQDDDAMQQAIQPPEEQFEPVPLFELESLGPKNDELDRFSFLEGRLDAKGTGGEEEDEALSQLYKLIDLYGESCDVKQFTRRIQKLYNAEFRPHQKGSPQWTLHSIMRFVEERGGMTPHLMRKGILQMLWQCLLLLRDGNLKLQNKRGQTRLDPTGFDQMTKLVRIMLPLIKSVER